VPEKAAFEITFPVVTGYHEQGQFDVFIDWNQVAKVTIDPRLICLVPEANVSVNSF
jgi:type III restriction enzyme